MQQVKHGHHLNFSRPKATEVQEKVLQFHIKKLSPTFTIISLARPKHALRITCAVPERPPQIQYGVALEAPQVYPLLAHDTWFSTPPKRTPRQPTPN